VTGVPGPHVARWRRVSVETPIRIRRGCMPASLHAPIRLGKERGVSARRRCAGTVVGAPCASRARWAYCICRLRNEFEALCNHLCLRPARGRRAAP